MKIKDWESFHDSLIENKIPFEVELTSLTIKFKTPYGNYEYLDKTKGGLPISELWFIKKVKDYSEKTDLQFSVNREAIKYICHPHKKDFHREQVIEIDLSSAYWNFAHREKIISDEIHSLSSKVSKPTRLAALGSLAKCIYSWKFDGMKWKLTNIHENQKADYFFRCCELTGYVMENLKTICGKDFIFFWVDAIFFFPEARPRVEEFLQDNDLLFKTYICDLATMQRSKKYLTVYSQQRFFENKDNEPRKFYLKKKTFDILNP